MNAYAELTLADNDSSEDIKVYIRFNDIAAFYTTKKTLAFGYNDYNGCNITLTSGKTIKVQEEISHVIAIIDKEESK